MNIAAHLLIALLIQWLVARASGSWLGGALAATAWAVAREVTQAEYRWIEAYEQGLRANMPWWGGLDPRVWQKIDPWIDWLAPTILVLAIALVQARRGARRPGNGASLNPS